MKSPQPHCGLKGCARDACGACLYYGYWLERGKAEKREELSDEEFVAGLGITPLTEEERSLVEDVHDILSGAGYIFDAADLLDALVYVFEGDFKNAALSSLAAVPIVGSGVKAVKVLKNAAEVAGVLAGAKKLVDAAFEGRKAAKAAKAAEEAAGSSKAGAKTITEGAGESVKSKLVSQTKEIRDKFYNEGLSQDKIDQIVLLPKSKKPKPEAYLRSKYIEEHKQSFKDSGVVKIMPSEPTGTIGGKGGTFVMSGDQLDNIIKSSKGDISKIEDALGFDRGYLGKNPVIVEIHKHTGLRIPQGNELGALSDYWLPGGYTLGGIKEAVIDPAPIGTYTFRYLF